MYGVKELLIPTQLEEALVLLADRPALRPLAGGTDVVVDLRRRKAEGVELMSLCKLEALTGLRRRGDGGLEIGAMTTFTELAQSPLIAEEFPMLKTAALAMGGPQIQNVATVGGNLCNGATSADSAPAMLAREAVLLLKSAAGERRMPVTEFYEGPGRVRLLPGELLVQIEIPPQAGPRRGDCYLKFSTRKAMDLALISCAATCTLDEAGNVTGAAVALGVAAPTPIRAYEAERALLGGPLSRETLERAGALALSAGTPRTSWRASAEYRSHMICTLTKQAFETAYTNAGGKL